MKKIAIVMAVLASVIMNSAATWQGSPFTNLKRDWTDKNDDYTYSEQVIDNLDRHTSIKKEIQNKLYYIF